MEHSGTPSQLPKIFIACNGCKSRKRRCDGVLPKCANCTKHNAECNYVASRRTRGPGKRERPREPPGQIHFSSGSPDAVPEVPLVTSANPSTNGLPRSTYEVPSNKPHLVHATNSTDSLETRMNRYHPLTIFPRFLQSDQFASHFKEVKRNIEEATVGRKFTKLMPSFITRRLIENTFPDIMAEHQLMKVSEFVALVDAQYDASIDDPAGHPSRWAIVNAIVALAIRAKTAPGSEAVISDIPYAYYRNATMVIPELILRDATLLSIQAFLSMALFSRAVSDTQASIMLASNASRQLDLLGSMGPSNGRVSENAGVEECVRLNRIAEAFNVANGSS